MKIFIGADHRGFEKKEILKEYLASNGYELIDKGAFTYVADDDFPDYSFAVALDVVKNPGSIGLLICGSSIGVCAAANKVTGIFASNPRSVKEAIEDRQHHGGNVLALTADNEDIETMKLILNNWISTGFLGGKYLRRIQKIQEYENNRK